MSMITSAVGNRTFGRTVDHCARHGRGCDVVKLLRPEESDYFVLKPKQSGLFSATLETVLRPKFSAVQGSKSLWDNNCSTQCPEKTWQVDSLSIKQAMKIQLN